MKAISHLLTLSVIGTTALLMPFNSQATQAASVSYSASTGDFATTNWTKALNIQKFDTKLGTLTGVVFSLTGDIQGTVKAENESNRAATITTELKSSLKLSSADVFGLPLIETIPLYQAVQSVGRYDGKRDFGGTSGFSSGLLSATKTDTKTYDNTNPFYSFISQAVSGPGNITFTLDALGLSNATGSGNITSNFTNLAKAGLTVTYNYDAAPPPSGPSAGVPEPNEILGGLVAIFLGVKFRKRFHQAKISA